MPTTGNGFRYPASTDAADGPTAFNNLASDVDSKTMLRIVAIDTPTANYTAVIGDKDGLVRMNVATACTFTIPPNSSVAFPVGSQFDGNQWGAGQVTVTPGAGVTLRAAGGRLKTTAQYSGFTCVQVAADEWWIAGDLSL